MSQRSQTAVAAAARRPYTPIVLDIPAPTVARAIGILRSGAMRADAFARLMWPERSANRTPGEQSRSGHALLRPLAQVGYVQQDGDIRTLRTVGTADGLGDSAVRTAVGSAVGPAVGLSVGLTVGPTDGLPVAPPLGLPFAGPDPLVERQRLHRLVALAVDPVPTVTHDVALGDLALRGEPVGAVLIEACGIVVLLGRSVNVYPPCGAPRTIVGLTPIESARVLHVRWLQLGQPPDLARPSAWITIEDGIIASSGFWRPAGAPASWVDQEDVGVRIQRQRAGAGLA
ncbi:MAG: hypothetical protein ACLP1X_04990 [Polyangiaceae bacterium]